MSTIDEDVDFAQSGDDGEDTNNSIQPIGYTGSSEFNDAPVFNRVYQNLRRRTERLRTEVRDLKYICDYDRGLLLWSEGTVRLESDTGLSRLVLSDVLVITPALAPGNNSGGRARGAQLFIGENPYAGALGVNDLSLVASSVYTGQRGYADGTSLASPGVLSIGSNSITVELAGENRAGGAGSIQATVTGSPRRHIRITYGTQAPGITVAQLIAAVNADETLFGTEGTFGLRHFVRASTSTLGGSPSIPDFAKTKLKGAYDAESYEVTDTQMAAFFSATSENLLREGEGLAIGFPAGLVQSGTETLGGGVWSSLGGRRQSLADAPIDRVGGSVLNVGGSATYGNLFNTGRQPELVPGSIPIGRRIGTQFVFIDGTTLGLDAPAISLSESFVTIARIAALQAQIYANFALQTGTTGASLVGYGGSTQWHAGTIDDGTATLSLPQGTVEAGLDAVVTQLSSRTTNSSGARRVGVEAIDGIASNGNLSKAIWLGSGSVRAAINKLLNGTGVDGFYSGINARVSERGHRMITYQPLWKDFGNVDSQGDGGGGIFLLSELNAPTNLGEFGNGTDAGLHGTPEKHSLVLQPLIYNNGGTDVLTGTETATAGAGPLITMGGMSSGAFNALVAKLPIVVRGGVYVPLVVAKITGLDVGDAQDGYFTVLAANTGSKQITFRTLEGFEPDFTGLAGTVTVAFYNVLSTGSNKLNSRVEAFHYAANKPFAVVGMSHSDDVLLEVYTPDGNTGALQSTYWTNKVQWASVRRVFGGVLTRETENILGANDKLLLDGIETGAPVDASAGHHHNTQYSVLAHHHDAAYAPIAHHHSSAYSLFNPILAVVNTVSLSDILTTPTGTPFTAPTTLGEATVGVVIHYKLYLVATTPGSPVYARLEFHEAGLTVPQGVIVAEHPTDSTVTVYGQLTIPVFGPGFNVTRAVTTNCAIGSEVEITYTVLYTYPTT